MERFGLRLFVAGAGPAYSDRPGALGSAYVVDAGAGRPIVLDLGQGTFPNLFRMGPPETFAAVLVSHLHPDHYVDLVPLRHYLKFERPDAGPLRVVAPSGLTDRLDAAAGEDAFCHGTFSIAALAPGPVEVDGAGVTVEAGRVTHRGEAYGFRVVPLGRGADAPGLVYSGDCGRASDLEALIRPGDTLLSEVSFGTGPVPVPDLHLDAAGVGDLAARTGVAAVLLTHLQMGYDAAATVDAVRARFGGPVRLVVPGDGEEIAGEPTPGD
ncbi:MAG TPA: MBL fold metallo-hydrolase [Candidatus Limnocylindrales bacterium]|nr:MBL fold metallo-hydrolase [Candidatus Limnocylindrales bacterium]